MESTPAGENPATVLLLDLDKPEPSAWEWSLDDNRRVGTQPFFEAKNVSLAKGEVHDFIIVARSARQTVRWRVVLKVEVGGTSKQYILSDKDGAPFVTSGRPSGGYTTQLHWAWDKGGGFTPFTQSELTP